MQNQHKPVLINEVIEQVKTKDRRKYSFLDVTLGSGGHSQAILEKLFQTKIPEIEATLLDLDQNAWTLFSERVTTKQWSISRKKPTEIILNQVAQLKFQQQNFAEFQEGKFDLIIADLGLSQNQLNSAARGFSYLKNESLDMRLDLEKNPVTAAILINQLPVKALTRLFKEYAQLDFAADLAIDIVRIRKQQPINNTFQLNQIINLSVKNISKQRKIQAKVYQALRIAVNTEYQNLEEFLQHCETMLNKNGKLLIITFQSGEEGILRKYAKLSTQLKLVGIKSAKAEELLQNPRARSAKLFYFVPAK